MLDMRWLLSRLKKKHLKVNIYEKYKIGTCGHYDLINTIPNGQTVKTINVTNELKKHYGSENIKVISTHDWKKRP